MILWTCGCQHITETQQFYVSTKFDLGIALWRSAPSLWYFFPDITMTVVLPICERLTFVFYQTFDLFVVFVEPVLVTFGFETDCFFADLLQSSFDKSLVFFYQKGFDSSFSC